MSNNTPNNSNKIFIFATVAIVLIVGGFVAFANFSGNDENTSAADNNQTNLETSRADSETVEISDTDSDSDNNPSEAVLTVNYANYSEEVLSQSQAKNRVLFFKADWCPSCTSLDKNIQNEIENIPNDTLILQVDYDKNQDLRQKYGVVSQHTLVQIDENGQEIQKWSGSRDLDAILSKIK